MSRGQCGGSFEALCDVLSTSLPGSFGSRSARLCVVLARVRMNLSGDDDDVQEKLRDVLEKESLEEVRSFVTRYSEDSFLDQNV